MTSDIKGMILSMIGLLLIITYILMPIGLICFEKGLDYMRENLK